MSAGPSQTRTPRGVAGARIPVAGPPVPAAAPPDLHEDAVPDPWWSPEWLKGWTASVSLHAMLLVVLAFWYFVPTRNNPLAFDSRLAGSPNGVPDGNTLTGGLNTPLPMPPAPLAADEVSITPAPLTHLDLDPIEPESIARRNKAPTRAAGGRTTTRARGMAMDSAWPGSRKAAS